MPRKKKEVPEKQVQIDGLPDEFEEDPNEIDTPELPTKFEGDDDEPPPQEEPPAEEPEETPPAEAAPSQPPEETAPPPLMQAFVEAQKQIRELQDRLNKQEESSQVATSKIYEAAERERDREASERLNAIKGEIVGAATEGDEAKRMMLMMEREDLLREMSQRETQRALKQYMEAQSAPPPPPQMNEQQQREAYYQEWCGRNTVSKEEHDRFWEMAPQVMSQQPYLNQAPFPMVLDTILGQVRASKPTSAAPAPAAAAVEGGNRRSSTAAPFDPYSKWSRADMERAAHFNGTDVDSYIKLLQKEHGNAR